jgi:hypothetical protein
MNYFYLITLFSTITSTLVDSKPMSKLPRNEISNDPIQVHVKAKHFNMNARLENEYKSDLKADGYESNEIFFPSNYISNGIEYSYYYDTYNQPFNEYYSYYDQIVPSVYAFDWYQKNYFPARNAYMDDYYFESFRDFYGEHDRGYYY